VAGMGTNLLVICFHKWTLDGLNVLVKYLQSNAECLLVMLLQNIYHGRNETESLVKDIPHQWWHVKERNME
jgi:hypothetical protein